MTFPRAQQRNQPRQTAFTLVELILVMVVLTTVLALGIPSFQQYFNHSALQDEAKRLLAATRLARSEAISTGFPIEIWFDFNLNRFGLRERNGGTAETHPVTSQRFFQLKPPYVLDLQSTSLSLPNTAASSSLASFASPAPPATTYSSYSTSPRIVFQPNGQIEAGSLNTLGIRDSKDATRVLYLVQSPLSRHYEIRKPNDPRLPQAAR